MLINLSKHNYLSLDFPQNAKMIECLMTTRWILALCSVCLSYLNSNSCQQQRAKDTEPSCKHKVEKDKDVKTSVNTCTLPGNKASATSKHSLASNFLYHNFYCEEKKTCYDKSYKPNRANCNANQPFLMRQTEMCHWLHSLLLGATVYGLSTEDGPHTAMQSVSSV